MPRSWWMKVGFVIFLVLLSIVGLVPTFVELIWLPENPEKAEEAEPGTTPETAATDGQPARPAPVADNPNLDDRDPPLPGWYKWWAENLTSSALALGLDLQGGLLLRYEVGVDEAIDDKLEQMASDVVAHLAERDIKVETRLVRQEDRIEVTFANGSEVGAIDDKFLTDNFANLTLQGVSGSVVTLGLSETYVKEMRENAVQQAVEIIRERIDALGVASPSVRVESGTRIVVELPGLSRRRAAAAERLISTTAVMTFRLIAEGQEAAQLFASMGARIPADSDITLFGGRLSALDQLDADGRLVAQGKDTLKRFVEANEDLIPTQRLIVYEKIEPEAQTPGASTAGTPARWQTRLVRTDLPLITGDNIEDARPATNATTNMPYVALKLDKFGGDTFYDITKEHVGEQLAILMDDTLVSDPVIRSEIPGGNVSIEMGSRNREQIRADVENLVVALRSGALPAPINQQAKTFIGPTLGRDSVVLGAWALIGGTLSVFIFMLVYYRFGGIVANIALGLNVIFILAILAALGTALTLPGIAGIVLTVGMAVDANVLIFERIREEMRAGETPRKCVQLGYDKAYWTIVDANLTTGFAALVLMEFGSGPVRGFAITLLIGIICSVFTAVFVSRLIFDWYLTRRDVERIPL